MNQDNAEVVQDDPVPQQIIDMSDPYAAMNPNAVAFQMKNQSEIVKLLRVNDFLQEYEYSLKGYVYDYGTKTLRKRKQAMIDEVGAEQLMGIVKSSCNNILCMSSFDDIKIAKILFDMNECLGDFLFLHGAQYNCAVDNWNILRNEAITLIISCLMRAREGEGSDKRFLSTTERRVEMFNTVNGQQPGMGSMGGMGRRGGLMGKFMGFLRGEN